MPPEGQVPPLARIVEVGFQVLAPVTVVTGVLYYFGYVRYQQFFAHFGVDLASAGISRTGYVLGSARIAFGPLAVALLVALAALGIHYALVPWLSRAGSRAKRLVFIAVGIWAVLLAGAAIAGLTDLTDLGNAILPPTALIAATLLTGYVVHLTSRFGLPVALREVFDRTRTARILLLSATLVVAVFWAVSTYAYERGREAAEAFELSLPLQARAIVYSQKRLFITGLGIEVDELAGTNSKFAYRYSGLRVLAHTSDRWLLVPPIWDPNTSTVTVLPDLSDDTRIDLAP